jgi:hypothetical protein
MNILAEIRRRGFVSGVLSGIAAAALANVARAHAPSGRAALALMQLLILG